MPLFFVLAEVHGNRTHHEHLLPVTGFEVQEAHQDLFTSIFRLIDFLLKVKVLENILL